MKFFKIFAISSLMLAAFSNANATDKVMVKVKGMVCSFCAQGIKKKFSSFDSVSKVDVNLDDKWVKIELADKKTLSDDQINGAIKDAGYNVVAIERSTDKTK